MTWDNQLDHIRFFLKQTILLQPFSNPFMFSLVFGHCSVWSVGIKKYHGYQG